MQCDEDERRQSVSWITKLKSYILGRLKKADVLDDILKVALGELGEALREAAESMIRTFDAADGIANNVKEQAIRQVLRGIVRKYGKEGQIPGWAIDYLVSRILALLRSREGEVEDVLPSPPNPPIVVPPPVVDPPIIPPVVTPPTGGVYDVEMDLIPDWKTYKNYDYVYALEASMGEVKWLVTRTFKEDADLSTGWRRIGIVLGGTLKREKT
jgi:hypothetical protein